MKSKTKKPFGIDSSGQVNSSGQSYFFKKLPYILLFFVLVFVVFVRLRLASLPLERDEGEYAYMGQCILDGISPYTEAYNMKLPGAYYAYAFIMAIFGQSATGIHIGLLLVNIATMYLLFLVGRKSMDEKAGAIAAASYGFLTAVPWTYGFAGHATHFIALFGTAGFFSILKAKENNKIGFTTLAGLLFGLAFLVKQQAVFLMLFGGVAILINNYKDANKGIKLVFLHTVIYGFAAILPYLMVVLIALNNGSFDKFWHWTVGYAGQYSGINDLGKGLEMLTNTLAAITHGVWGFWLAGIAGFLALFYAAIKKENKRLLLFFAIFSFLCVCPGLYFRNHYFIAFFPAFALLIGATFKLMDEWVLSNKPYVSLLIFLAFAIISIVTYSAFYFTYTVPEFCTRIYGKNPFQESQEVAKFIKENTREGERIAVFGSEPQIYFYSQRKAATGYLYTYPLMENQPYHKEMQAEMQAEIERNKPKYLVVINSSISWLAGPNSDDSILKWYAEYGPKNYHPVGIADIISPGNTRYMWKDDLKTYQKQGKEDITIMERN